MCKIFMYVHVHLCIFYIFLYRGLIIINCTGNTWYPLIKQCYQKPIKPIKTGGTNPHFPSFLSDQWLNLRAGLRSVVLSINLRWLWYCFKISYEFLNCTLCSVFDLLWNWTVLEHRLERSVLIFIERVLEIEGGLQSL